MQKCFKNASVRVMALKKILARGTSKPRNPYLIGSGKYLFYTDIFLSGQESPSHRVRSHRVTESPSQESPSQ